MQHPINIRTGFRRAASCALRIARHGTAAALIGTGNLLIGTGRALKFCGRKIRPAAKPAPKPHSRPARPASLRRMRAVPQPAA